jgi:hypothetical protein
VTWFRRGREEPTAPPAPLADEDSPDRLRRRLWELVQFVNRNAGRLPVDAVVLARQVTDRVREVIEIAAERPLDVYAVVQINGIVGDYLPTTLRTYLALDPAVTERPDPAGRTPRTALLDQLDALDRAADELYAATRAHDVDALFTQGNFLRTKFTGSDLDL